MTNQEIPIFSSFQELFEFAVTNLFRQGVRSTEAGECRYRTTAGHRCIVGSLIPDNYYATEMEGLRVTGIVCNSFFPKFADYIRTHPVFAENLGLLARMQLLLHDQCIDKIRSVVYLDIVTQFAERHNLNTNFIEALKVEVVNEIQ